MTRSTLGWSGHNERKGKEKFKKVYLSSVEGTNRRGRPLGRWEDRVREYVSEKGVRGSRLEWAQRKYRMGSGGDPSAVATPLRDASTERGASDLLTD